MKRLPAASALGLWAILSALASGPGCVAAATEAPAAPAVASASSNYSTLPDAPWRRADPRKTQRPLNTAAPTILLRGARLLLGDGGEIRNGHLLLKDGRIASVGAGPGDAPEGAVVIDASGKTITPGLVDTHSHMGVYPAPAAKAHADGNEMTMPVTADVRAVDAFWPQDPSIERAVAGGTTTAQVLPGSGNLVGGRGVTLKLTDATTARQMRFVGAPDGLKMACGENPKRIYGQRKTKPMSRMGNLALQRAAFLEARRLIDEWDKWREDEVKRRKSDARRRRERAEQRADRERKRQACDRGGYAPGTCREWARAWATTPLSRLEPSTASLPPARSLSTETLAAAIEGHILVHVHCYRADDMASIIALADEMGFSIRSFHHALEAYKIRATLAKRRIGVSTWADWWGFKMEAYDGIPQNLALVSSAGGLAIVHSDSPEGIRRLNQEAAKGMWSGRHSGLRITEAEAIKWVTLNPAWALGVDRWIGSLETGKDADVVVWDRNPFSVYARPERVYINGIERFRMGKKTKPWSDFEAQP